MFGRFFSIMLSPAPRANIGACLLKIHFKECLEKENKYSVLRNGVMPVPYRCSSSTISVIPGVVMPFALLLSLVALAPASLSSSAAFAQTSPSCLGFPASITGTPGADSIVGTPGRDVIVTLGGNDRVNALGGDDIICGGASGSKTFVGGEGEDLIIGGNGNDFFSGGNGNDWLDGGNGNDTLFGEDGNDRLDGGNGNDTVYGGDGNDFMSGDAFLNNAKPSIDSADGGPDFDTCIRAETEVNCEAV